MPGGQGSGRGGVAWSRGRGVDTGGGAAKERW